MDILGILSAFRDLLHFKFSTVTIFRTWLGTNNKESDCTTAFHCLPLWTRRFKTFSWPK